MSYSICPQGKPICDHRCPATPRTQGQAVEAWLRWKHNGRDLPDGCKPCQAPEYVREEWTK